MENGPAKAIVSCPCGRPSYRQCCGLLHEGAPAVTAEDLMRSRYSAFALGLDNYLFRTWHPRTRPADIETGDTQWLNLRILDTVDGGPNDETGIVEFFAHFEGGAMRERSRFERRAGRWMYVDAE